MVTSKPTEPIGNFDEATGEWWLRVFWTCPLLGKYLCCRPGAMSDGLSVPRPLWLFVHPYSPSRFTAGFLHDQLYRTKLIARWVADLLFLYYLLLFSKPAKPSWYRWALWVVNIAIAFLCYLMVSLFGWIAWKRKTPEQVRDARRYAYLSDRDISREIGGLNVAPLDPVILQQLEATA